MLRLVAGASLGLGEQVWRPRPDSAKHRAQIRLYVRPRPSAIKRKRVEKLKRDRLLVHSGAFERAFLPDDVARLRRCYDSLPLTTEGL